MLSLANFRLPCLRPLFAFCLLIVSFPAQAQTIANSSFETPSLTETHGFAFNPTGAGWTFTGNSGIQSNGSEWGVDNAANGTQTAFLKGRSYGIEGILGSISQTVNFTSTGTFAVSFQAAQRQGQIQPLMLSVDGMQVGELMTPPGNSFSTLISAAFTINTTGEHTIMLSATDNSADLSTMVDSVILVPASSVPIVHVQTGTWQPDPAVAGQTITSNVTSAVDNPYQPSNGHSISQYWIWTTGRLYVSNDGTSGTFTSSHRNSGIYWTQGYPTTLFKGIFYDPGYYIIKVTATLTYHDDTTNTDILTCSGDGYIGGGASDLAAQASATQPRHRPVTSNAAAITGFPVVSARKLQYAMALLHKSRPCVKMHG